MLLVYGKEKTSKRFQPMDMSSGQLVSKLFYASMFDDKQREELQKEVDFMNENNPDYIFEIREQKSKSEEEMTDAMIERQNERLWDLADAETVQGERQQDLIDIYRHER